MQRLLLQITVSKGHIAGNVPHVMMTVLPRSAGREQPGLLLAREVAFPVLAIVAIVAFADVRIPIGLPGHRGLVWLTLLVAVVLATRRRSTVVAVGAASTSATLAIHVPDGAAAAGSARYLAAAILLYAVAVVPVVRGRRWLLVLAAAPIHLVALADSIAVLLGGRAHLLFSVGTAEKTFFHLGFGLAAGLLGWAIASGIGGRFAPAKSAGS